MAVGPKGPCKYGILTNFPLDIPETFDSNVACCLATGEADPIKGSVTFTSDCMTCWVSQRSDLTVTDNEVDVLFVRGQDLKMVKGNYHKYSSSYMYERRGLDGSKRKLIPMQ